MDLAGHRLSCQEAFAWTFNPMAYRVAHDVGKRLGDGIEQGLVNVGLLTAEHEFNLFFATLCNITNHPREPAEQLINRDHANLHN